MKILILGFTKLKYMPYMNFYLDNIDANKNDVHLLYWNRDLKQEDVSKYPNISFHEFKCYQEDDVSKFSKIISFIKYRKFAKSVIHKGNYDFIIVLHSLTGVLIADVLKKKFKNNFIFDYRDSTYEGLAPFKKIVADLVKNSKATFVSSDGFRKYLPDSEREKTFTSHNLLIDSLSHREEKRKNGTESDKIRISFWGFIRHEEINSEIIRKIAADSRFELHYYGREQQIAINLKNFAKEISAKNIFFHGEYSPEERYDFVRNTDIIHNIYFDSNTMLAMGNKYYDGAIFYLPQICMKGSFMGACAKNAGIGFECDPFSKTFTDEIYSCYNGLDKNELFNKCDFEIERILKEIYFGRKKINTIINE